VEKRPNKLYKWRDVILGLRRVFLVRRVAIKREKKRVKVNPAFLKSFFGKTEIVDSLTAGSDWFLESKFATPGVSFSCFHL